LKSKTNKFVKKTHNDDRKVLFNVLQNNQMQKIAPAESKTISTPSIRLMSDAAALLIVKPQINTSPAIMAKQSAYDHLVRLDCSSLQVGLLLLSAY
jgi:hypothetical protein